MDACLKVLKLAIEKKIAPDEQSMSLIDREIQEHVKSCVSCKNFMKAKDALCEPESRGPNHQSHSGTGINKLFGEFDKGDRVQLTSSPDHIGVVLSGPQSIGENTYYSVLFDLEAPAVLYAADALRKYKEPPNALELLKKKEFASPAEFATFLVLKKLEIPLSDNLYTFYSSRTQFEVHQFKPILKFLNSIDQRLLLADEVGLGKTIEAGIILKELDKRLRGLSRVLVICPATLTQKWKGELKSRFNEDFSILGHADIMQFIERYGAYGDVELLRGICSLETMRKFVNQLREFRVHFDLVIFDEAHHLRNPDTISNELGEVLSEYADAMLMLTATPLHLGSENLFNLFRIMLPQQFDNFTLFQQLIEPNQYVNAASKLIHDPPRCLELLQKVETTSQKNRFLGNPYYKECVSRLSRLNEVSREDAIYLQRRLVELNTLSHIFTRTKKKDVEPRFPTREARVITVEFTKEEMDFYNAVTEFVEARFMTDWQSGQGISFARIMPQRQVASCIPAMRGYLEDQRKSSILLASREWEGDDIGERDSGRPKLTSMERVATNKLLSAMNKLDGKDTKFEKFFEALQNCEAEFQGQGKMLKIIVFSYFKKTLEYLYHQLARRGYEKRAVMIHGDIHPKIREKAVERFRDNAQIELLLSSEVGSEGLDFQFCNVMFNYDLPWNPMKVEQRIGRLDRYGQENDKILIYNFSIANTIDQIILHRLYERINLFEKYLGDLEVILGDQITELTREMFNPTLTNEQKARKAELTALNIERKIKEMEEFERESEKFLGQDEYFNAEVSGIKNTKRFITSHEVRLLLSSFLNMIRTSTTIRPPKSGRENVYILKTDEEFRRFIRAYSEGMSGRDEIIRTLDRDGGTPVTFDSEEACKDRSLMFITIHHPIIKCIAKYMGEQDFGLKPTASLLIKSPIAKPGDYLYFVYLLEEYSLKTTLKLVPLLVSIKDRNVVHIVDELSEMFLGLIPTATEFVDGVGVFNEKDVEECSKTAHEYIAMLKEDEEKSLATSNYSLVNSRKEGKEQSYRMKINRVQKTLENILADSRTADERLIRMYRARLHNLEDQLNKDVDELIKKQGAYVGFRLLSAGFVRFE